VLSAVFSPDGKQVLSGGADPRPRLWEAGTGKPIREFDKLHEGEVWLVRYAEGVATSTGADRVVHWDTTTGRVRMIGGRRDAILGTIVGGKPHITPGVAPGLDARVANEAGSFALSGLGSAVLDLWKRGDEDRPVARLTGADEPVRAMAVSADGRRVLAYADDKALRLWATDVSTPAPPRPSVPAKAKARGKAKAKAPPPPPPRNDNTPQLTDRLDWESETAVSCLALDANGQHALLGNADGSLQLWHLPP
jgi:WD40 repeat protein